MASSSRLTVVGCTHATAGVLVRGTYSPHSNNHGRTVFKKSEKVHNLDVCIYFWDDRDGPEFCGWWFGPVVGGDTVWAYNKARAMTPPSSGWQVPHDGPVDQTLKISTQAAPAATTAASASAGSGQPSAAKVVVPPARAGVQPQPAVAGASAGTKPVRVQPPSTAGAKPAAATAGAKPGAKPAVVKPPPTAGTKPPALSPASEAKDSDAEMRYIPGKGGYYKRLQMEAQKTSAQPPKMMNNKQLEDLKRKREEEARQKVQANKAVLMARKAIQKLRTATPESFDELNSELEMALMQELPKCGALEDQIRQEAATQVEQVRKWIDARRHQPGLSGVQSSAGGADGAAPMVVQVPASEVGLLMGRGGSALKRLSEATGCTISVQPRRQIEQGGTVAVRLSGGTKQRRLAAEAIRDVVEGGDADVAAARAQGQIVVPHEVADVDRRAWMAWRLVPVEHEFKVQAALSRGSVRFRAADVGAPPAAEALKRLYEAAEQAIGETQAVVEMSVDARSDKDPEGTNFDAVVGPLVDQYGLLVGLLKPRDDIVPVQLMGPPEPARDAAAILWARLVQGKLTALVLLAPGQIQVMSQQMAGDFANDLRDLESEYKVQVTQGGTTMWIAGESVDDIASAKRMLQEMLQFYLPDGITWLQQLKPPVIDQLQKDKELRVLTARPECVLALDAAEGTAWICGAGRADVQRRIEDVILAARGADVKPGEDATAQAKG